MSDPLLDAQNQLPQDNAEVQANDLTWKNYIPDDVIQGLNIDVSTITRVQFQTQDPIEKYRAECVYLFRMQDIAGNNFMYGGFETNSKYHPGVRLIDSGSILTRMQQSVVDAASMPVRSLVDYRKEGRIDNPDAKQRGEIKALFNSPKFLGGAIISGKNNNIVIEWAGKLIGLLAGIDVSKMKTVQSVQDAINIVQPKEA